MTRRDAETVHEIHVGMTRNTTLTDRTETALADFTAWVESCTTLGALQEAVTHVNRLSALVRTQHATLQDAAKTAFAFRVGARVVLVHDANKLGGAVGTITKITAKYAHVSLDDAVKVRVGFMSLEPLPVTDPRYSEAAREEALAQAKQQHQRALDQAAQWRQEHVTILGMTDEQRTKMEKGLDEDLAAGR